MNIQIERDWEAAALKIINNIAKEDIKKLNRVMNKICEQEFLHDIKIEEIGFSTQYGIIECAAKTYEGHDFGIALPTGTNGLYNKHDTAIQYFNVNRDLEIMSLEHFKKQLPNWFWDEKEYREFVEHWEE